MLPHELEQLPFFQDLTPEQLELIQPLFVLCECHSGTVLFEQGEPAVYLYLLITGEVTIRYKPDDGPDIMVTRIRDGGMVGWSAAVGRRVYTSAAVCTEFTRLLRVRGIDLQELCERQPETGLLVLDRLSRVVAERTHAGQSQILALLEIGLRNGVH